MSLRPYQTEAVAFLTGRKKALLALPPGSGKTGTVASALKPCQRVLVVAPNGPVLAHWKAEGEQWGHRRMFVGTGTPRARELLRSGAAAGMHDLILNYECFLRDIEHLVEIPWDAVVFDEAHRLKNRQSQTFKAAKRIKSEHLYLVTGTPILNRAEELWSYLHLMDPKAYRGFWAWAESYFKINTPRYRGRLVREVGKIKSKEHERILREKTHVRMFFRPLAEILPDLPEVTETYYEVDLSDAEAEAYDTMARNFWMEVGGDIVQAPNHIAKTTRLRQLCSDWSAWGEPPGTKAQAVAQLVDELDGEPCVIFVAFRATADALADMLPNAYAYHGGKDVMARNDAIIGFCKGEVSQLVATIATLGEGIDGLQHTAHTAIFLDRDWTPARNDQAVARLRRQGQKDSVNVIHVVARNSMDDVVSTALRDKRDVITAIIEQGTANHAVHQ